MLAALAHCLIRFYFICLNHGTVDLRAEMEDLDMEADDVVEAGGGGAFLPLRDDAVQCFKEHAGKPSTALTSHGFEQHFGDVIHV